MRKLDIVFYLGSFWFGDVIIMKNLSKRACIHQRKRKTDGTWAKFSTGIFITFSSIPYPIIIIIEEGIKGLFSLSKSPRQSLIQKLLLFRTQMSNLNSSVLC